MEKQIFKKILSIDHILIFISFFCFAHSIAYKVNADIKYNRINNCLNYLQLNYSDILIDENKIDWIDDLKKQLLPFTTFDPLLEKDVLNIEECIKQQIFTEKNFKSVMESTITVQNILTDTRQRLSFGYDTTLYTSIILLFITLFLIAEKNQKKQKEIDHLNIMTETQIKFSRDLHDGVAQDLAALKIYLQENEIEKSSFYADQALQEVRYLIGTMHFDLSKGFDQIIHQTLLLFEANYGIKTQFFNASSYANKLNNDFQIEFFRILQEALSNIARHSKATLVTVKLTDLGNDFRFIITDNGIGLNQQNLDSENTGDTKSHYGLDNIKERVQAMNGTVEFINEGGTTIAICIKNIIR